MLNKYIYVLECHREYRLAKFNIQQSKIYFINLFLSLVDQSK